MKRPDLRELTIYLNYVECALSSSRIKFHHDKMLQNFWLICAYCQRLTKVFPAPRLTMGALCTNTYLLKHIFICCIPRTPFLAEICKAKMKCKQRQGVFQKLKNKSPGPCMKPKGKTNGMIQKYTKARR